MMVAGLTEWNDLQHQSRQQDNHCPNAFEKMSIRHSIFSLVMMGRMLDHQFQSPMTYCLLEYAANLIIEKNSHNSVYDEA